MFLGPADTAALNHAAEDLIKFEKLPGISGAAPSCSIGTGRPMTYRRYSASVSTGTGSKNADDLRGHQALEGGIDKENNWKVESHHSQRCVQEKLENDAFGIQSASDEPVF